MDDAAEKKRLIDPKVVMLMLLIIVVVAATAWFYHGSSEWEVTKDQVKNTMHMPYNMIAIVEDFDQTKQPKPGETVRKKVSFTNTGTLDVMVRCSFRDSWTAEDGTILSNKYMGGDSGSDELDAMIKNRTTGEFNWIYMDDGYYYYKKTLEAGGSTGVFIESVTLSEDAPSDYANAEYELEFRVEAVTCQSTDLEAVREFWGKLPVIKSGGNIEWQD